TGFAFKGDGSLRVFLNNRAVFYLQREFGLGLPLLMENVIGDFDLLEFQAVCRLLLGLRRTGQDRDYQNQVLHIFLRELPAGAACFGWPQAGSPLRGYAAYGYRGRRRTAMHARSIKDQQGIKSG